MTVLPKNYNTFCIASYMVLSLDKKPKAKAKSVGNKMIRKAALTEEAASEESHESDSEEQGFVEARLLGQEHRPTIFDLKA